MAEAIISTVIGGLILMIIEIIFKSAGRPSPARRAWLRLTNRVAHSSKIKNARPEPLSEILAEPISYLLAFLRDDQELHELHYGEYGRTGNMRLIRDVFAPGPGRSRERPETKPRLYLTSWPVFIYTKRSRVLPLSARSAISHQLEAVVRGIEGRIEDGWIKVSEGPGSAPPPFVGARDIVTISYRHSIRAAHILLSIGKRQDFVLAILGRMLAPNSTMRNPTGGWAQSDVLHREDDLWCAAYAIAFIYDCLQSKLTLGLRNREATELEGAIHSTLIWFKEQWGSPLKWSYSKLKWEENAPAVLIEIAPALLRYDREFGISVLDKLAEYLDPVGHPSEAILVLQVYATASEIATRLGYACYFFREHSEIAKMSWSRLCEFAIANINVGTNAADAAMLLDMLLDSRN